jgi:hypothetical protein
MEIDKIVDDLPARISRSVAEYWLTRQNQVEKQQNSGKNDQGASRLSEKQV